MFSLYSAMPARASHGIHSVSVRSDRYKFIVDHRSHTEEFYDLEADSEEKNNLIQSLSEDQERFAEECRIECARRYEKKASDFKIDEAKKQ